MEVMELQARLAEVGGRAVVKIKVAGPDGPEKCIELSCVEVVTDDSGETVFLSSQRRG